jgi:hypothetical protein
VLAVQVAPAAPTLAAVTATIAPPEPAAVVTPAMTWLAGCAVALAALLTIAVGIFPGPLFDFAQQAAQMLVR